MVTSRGRKNSQSSCLTQHARLMTKWIAVKVFVEQLIIRITRLWAQVLEDKINNNQTKPALNAGLLGVLVKKKHQFESHRNLNRNWPALNSAASARHKRRRCVMRTPVDNTTSQIKRNKHEYTPIQYAFASQQHGNANFLNWQSLRSAFAPWPWVLPASMCAGIPNRQSLTGKKKSIKATC
jgi:hypothetical protein